MTSNLDYERRKAVANAWKKEKGLVIGGKGTRDWTQKEQREIISKGRATGYEGHHMKSVDGHNSRAGDANNIQFLNRKEHLAAHGGDFHNNTNGYYDYKTGEMHSFGRNKPSIATKELSNPLSGHQIKNIHKETSSDSKIEETKNKAKALESRKINKVKTKADGESKTLSRQRDSKHSESASTSTQSKTLAMQRSTRGEASRTATRTKKEGQSH